MLRAGKKSGGFTLIELLVVIAILVLLIGILVPALSHVRETAKKSATASQMSGIQMAIDAYYQSFNAYPGMIAETTYDWAEGGGGSVQFSDSQALVTSLTRYFCTPNQDNSNPAMQMVPINGLSGANATWTSANPSVPPRDYSENTVINATTGNRTGKVYNSYYNATPAELSSAICSNTDTATADLYTQPTFIDKAYGSVALPIIYYRAAQKYDPTIAGSMPVSNDTTHATNAQFYTSSNMYLADTNLQSTSKVSADFTNAKVGNLTAQHLDLKSADASQDILTTPAGSSGGTVTTTPRGAYVLISAGADRYYGPNPNNAGKVDDIVISGGGF